MTERPRQIFRPEALRSAGVTEAPETVDVRDHRPWWLSWWLTGVLAGAVGVLAAVPVEDRLPVVVSGSVLCPATAQRTVPTTGPYELEAAGRRIDVVLEGPDGGASCGPGRPAARIRGDLPAGSAVLVTGSRSFVDRIVGA